MDRAFAIIASESVGGRSCIGLLSSESVGLMSEFEGKADSARATFRSRLDRSGRRSSSVSHFKLKSNLPICCDCGGVLEHQNVKAEADCAVLLIDDDCVSACLRQRLRNYQRVNCADERDTGFASLFWHLKRSLPITTIGAPRRERL